MPLPFIDPTAFGVFPQVQQQQQPDDILNQRYLQLFQPEHMYNDRLLSLLDQIPQRPQPNFWQKLGAGMVGLGPGGYKAAEDALYGNYDRQMQDWQARYQPTLQAANLERNNNALNRQFAADLMRQDYQDRNLERMFGRDRITAQHYQNMDEARFENVDIRRWKAQHPNAVIKDYNGIAYGIDPQTKESVPIIDGDTGQPLRTGNLSDTDSLRIKHQYRTEEIAQGGKIRENLQEDKQNEPKWSAPFQKANGQVVRYDQDGNEQVLSENPISKVGTGSGTGAGGLKPEISTQQKQRIINNAMSVIAGDRRIRPFIKFNPDTGLPEIAEVGTTTGGGFWSSTPKITLDQKSHDDLYNRIYGSVLGLSSQTMPSHQSTTTPNAATPPNKTIQNLQPGQKIPPKGLIQMKKPDGSTTWINMNDLDRALAQKWTKVVP